MIDWIKLYQWFDRNMSFYLWGLFIGAMMLQNIEFGILAVLLLIYHRIDKMEIQITINNNVVNIKQKKDDNDLQK